MQKNYIVVVTKKQLDIVIEEIDAITIKKQPSKGYKWFWEEVLKNYKTFPKPILEGTIDNQALSDLISVAENIIKERTRRQQ